MHAHALLAAVVALLAPAAASAGEAASPSPVPTLLMSPLPLPVVEDGRLVNYIFVNLRLTLSPKADADKLREKEPFFRDALVRAAHRTRLAAANDNNRVDEPRLRAILLAESARIAGPGVVTGVQLVRADPQHRVSNR